MQIIGYIEGAPPAPMANLTNKSILRGATSLTFTRADVGHAEVLSRAATSSRRDNVSAMATRSAPSSAWACIRAIRPRR